MSSLPYPTYSPLVPRSGDSLVPNPWSLLTTYTVQDPNTGVLTVTAKCDDLKTSTDAEAPRKTITLQLKASQLGEEVKRIIEGTDNDPKWGNFAGANKKITRVTLSIPIFTSCLQDHIIQKPMVWDTRYPTSFRPHENSTFYIYSFGGTGETPRRGYMDDPKTVQQAIIEKMREGIEPLCRCSFEGCTEIPESFSALDVKFEYSPIDNSGDKKVTVFAAGSEVDNWVERRTLGWLVPR